MAARPTRRRGKRGVPEGWKAPMELPWKRPRMRQVGTWNRGRRAVPDGMELKFHDIDWDEAAADFSAGVISNTSSLVLIGQGVTESTRIGRKAVIRSIGWRGKLLLEFGAGGGLVQAETCRLMLVQDTQCNGAAPLVSTVAGVLESANYQSFNNLSNKGRFRVLYDQFFTLNAQAAAGDGAVNDTASHELTFDFFKKCNIPMEYSGTASPSVIGEVRTNNIFGILIGATVNQTYSMDSKLRFRFSDG